MIKRLIETARNVSVLRKIWILLPKTFRHSFLQPPKQPFEDKACYCFPSKVIHTNDPQTQKHYELLWRGYPEEEQIKRDIQVVQNYTMTTYDGLASLSDQVRYCEQNSIAGAYVETGSWKGGAVGMMALANQRWGKSTREIHVFDSFQGLPQPREDEFNELVGSAFSIGKTDCRGQLKPIGACVASKEDVEELLFNRIGYDKHSVRIHVGWFQDTIPLARREISKIAILRLDGDLYESTLVCLEHLFPLVVEGGFVIIDDWGTFEGCRRAALEYFGRNNLHIYPHLADGTVRYFVKK